MDINKILSSIEGIEDNSNKVEKDFIFFALSGLNTHGEKYIDQAIKNGARYIIVDQNSKIEIKQDNVGIIKIENPRKFLSKILSLYHTEKPEHIVAVTGTNGKTSVVNFYQQICYLLNFKSASIGTLGIIDSDNQFKSKDGPNLTSPSPTELHKILKTLHEKKFTHVAIEASSHGIYQHRIDYLNFKAVGFTNFSQDHLDYHTTLQKYFNAKLQIFNEVLESDKYAVLNTDISEFDILNQTCKNRNIKVIEYGKKAKDLEILCSTDGEWKVKVFGKKYLLNSKIKGEFQLYNILCSIGLATACELPIDNVMNIVSKIKAAKGRLELARNYNGAEIYIDYAHTPDSLKTVLHTLRKSCKGELHVLFGCGGQRDTSKRRVMGSIANDLADHIIITDDNPREENASLIRQQFSKFCPKGYEIEGRANAIKYAINNLKNNDVLVIAGKGHENYQIIGKDKIHLSDFEEVARF